MQCAQCCWRALSRTFPPRQALSQGFNESRALKDEAPLDEAPLRQGQMTPTRGRPGDRKAAETPPPDTATAESPTDSPTTLGWIRDTVSSAVSGATASPPPQPEAPAEGTNNSWVYERAELLDRLKKESDMRAKAEANTQTCVLAACRALFVLCWASFSYTVRSAVNSSDSLLVGPAGDRCDFH